MSIKAVRVPDESYTWAGPESLLEAIVATADRFGVHYGDHRLLCGLFWSDPPSWEEMADALAFLVERGDLRIEDGPMNIYDDEPLKVCRIQRRSRFERYRLRQAFTAEQRRRIYQRDGWKCRTCGSMADLTLDHIVPFSKGGSDADDNLQALCRPCNSRKGNRGS